MGRERGAGAGWGVGRGWGEMGASVGAMEPGEIGFSHLAVMARTAIAPGAKFDETRLLEVARKTSPGKFYYESLHYRHSVDAKGYAAEQVDLVENRRLWLSKGEDGGLLINGVLDPVGGAAFRTALEPLARRAGWNDDRNVEKRYADALVELASHCGPAKVPIHGPPPLPTP